MQISHSQDIFLEIISVSQSFLHIISFILTGLQSQNSHCEASVTQVQSPQSFWICLGLPGGSEVKASACVCLQCGKPGFDSWSGRSPGEGNGNPLQYSCLENTMDGGAWWAAVHRVAGSRTRLSDFIFTFHSLKMKLTKTTSLINKDVIWEHQSNFRHKLVNQI